MVTKKRKTRSKSSMDALKEWRLKHAEDYAATIMGEPPKVPMIRVLPIPGVVMLMGFRGMGKTGEAHYISEELHERKNMPTALHLPSITDKQIKEMKRFLPEWVVITRSFEEWPKKSLVIVDEAAQVAHARRTQGKDAVELDNLIGISRQRGQLIVFISHHSRKLDPNIIHEVNQIHWKRPSYAHQIFERDELSDFSMKAFDYFRELAKGKVWRECTDRQRDIIKSHTLILDMEDFKFMQSRNGLPSYWNDRISKIFEDIKNTRKEDEIGVPGYR